MNGSLFGLPNAVKALAVSALRIAGVQVIPPPSGTTNGYVLTANSGVAAGADWEAGGGGGTVTSVALTVPSDLTVAGSPIVGAGTLAVTRNSQSGNKALISPADGSSGVPSYRALQAADAPFAALAAGTTFL